jgi:geranylgeranyl reductase family protein
MSTRTGTDWDLVVVGAGPAGSATALGALAADPSLRVLLLDRADFPRDKSCGDGIAPHAVDVLRGVGAGDVVDGWAPLRRLEISRGDPRDGHAVAGDMSRPAWVVPRRVLDARLVERAVAAGAVLRRRRVGALTRAGDRVVLDDGTRGRVLVGADGAHSGVRAALATGPSRRRALAIRGYVPTQPAWRGSQVIRFGERRQPSYAWAFDRGDGLANVGYGELVGAEPLSRAALLDELERLLPGTVGDPDVRWLGHHLPLSGWRWHQPDGPVLLVGDAAGLVNPLTGEGIYYAVATGVLAGRAAAGAIAAGDPAGAGAAHRRAVRRLLGAHLRHTSATARLARHPSFIDAGLRAADRSRPAFEAMVEIGLGRGRVTPRLAGGLVTGLVTGLATGLATGRHQQLSPPSPPTHR